MVRLRVDFQPYTSLDLASEKMTDLGLHRGNLKSGFICIGLLNGFFALVTVKEEDELWISRSLHMIPGVVSVSRG